METDTPKKTRKTRAASKFLILAHQNDTTGEYHPALRTITDTAATLKAARQKIADNKVYSWLLV